MAVTPSALIAPSAIAGPGDLWSLPVLWQEDWGGGFRITSSYRTIITRGQNGTPSRVGTRNRPARNLEYAVTGLREGDLFYWREELYRRAEAHQLLPVACDTVLIGESVAAGATVIPGDYTDRRYFPGGYVALAPLSRRALLPVYHIGTLAAVADGAITLADPVPETLPGPVRIVPLCECLPAAANEAALVDPVSGTVRFTALERAGRSALPAWLAAGGTPAGALLYENLPVLTARPDFRQATIGAAADEEQAASGLAVTMLRRGGVYGTAGLTWGGRRRDMVDILRFFDGRRGRCLPFWLPSPTADMTVTGIAPGSSVSVRAGGYTIDWRRWSHIGIRYREDNEDKFWWGAIQEVTRSGGTDTVACAAPAVPLAAVDMVHLGYRAAFAADAVTESWATDDFLTIGLPAAEQADNTLGPGITPPPPAPPPLPPGPPPDGGGGDPPAGPMCNPLYDCNGNATGLGIPAGSASGLVYNPGDGGGYTPGGEEVPCTGLEVLDGWNPGDGDEEWWPPCPEPVCCCITGTGHSSMSLEECIILGGVACEESPTGECCWMEGAEFKCCDCTEVEGGGDGGDPPLFASLSFGGGEGTADEEPEEAAAPAARARAPSGGADARKGAGVISRPVWQSADARARKLAARAIIAETPGYIYINTRSAAWQALRDHVTGRAWRPLVRAGGLPEGQSLPRRMPRHREEWGPLMWHLLHSRARTYPARGMEAGPERQWLDAFAAALPCGPCRNGFRALLVSSPPPLSAPAPDAFFKWTVEAHNRVNDALGKPRMTYRKAAALYPEAR